MKLRTKLALSLVTVAVLAAAAIGWFAYVATVNQLNSEIDRSLTEVATIANTATDGHDGHGAHDGRSGVDPAASLVQTLAQDGSVMNSPDGLVVPVSSEDEQVASGSSSGGYYRDVVIDHAPYRVLIVAAEHGGAIQAVRPLAERNDVLDALRIRILVAAVVVTVLAGLCGWLLARQITRRLSRLAAAVQTVATTGRLDVPIDDTARDEAGQVAASFAHMLLVLNRSQTAQRQLAQDAGHELRTPLTSLRTNLDVLARYSNLDAAQRERVVADLQSETQELNVMVSELLELTAGDLHTRPAEEVALGRAAARVVERAARRHQRQIELHTDDSATVASWTAVERAISNLLDNAVKFSPADSPIEVTVASGRITVRDRGPGFVPADFPRVFDRFYRADSARALPGSGLGLAIVADVASSFGGEAFAGNHADGGAEIGFVLPSVIPTVV